MEQKKRPNHDSSSSVWRSRGNGELFIICICSPAIHIEEWDRHYCHRWVFAGSPLFRSNFKLGTIDSKLHEAWSGEG